MNLRIYSLYILLPFCKKKSSNNALSIAPIYVMIFLLSIFRPGISIGQGKTLQKIGIGEQVPQLQINKILNYPGKSINISDFKSKLLILDFMATSCGSCIEALPHLDSLQKLFGDRVTIIIISNEKEEKMRSFLKSNSFANKIKMPVIFEDTILAKWFPHRYVSHEVWINRGTVMAITGMEYVTASNIHELLQGERTDWVVKDDVPDFNYLRPLLELDTANITPEHLPSNLYYSAFVNHINGVGMRKNTAVDTSNHTKRVTYINYSPLDFFRSLQTDQSYFTLCHIALQLQQPEKVYFRYRSGYRDDWENKNTFCYETILPLSTSDEELRKKILMDLNLYLHLNAVVIDKETTCYEISCDSSRSPAEPLIGMEPNSLSFSTINDLLYILNRKYIGTPYYTTLEVGKVINISIPTEALKDNVSINEALKKLHFRITPVRKKIRMLLISDY